MNKVTKTTEDGKVKYVLTTEDGKSFNCERWYEKKTNAWHVKLPKDNPSGRTYIRESNFDKSNTYEFETKTEFRSGLTGGGWRSKMTPEEVKEVERAEKVIEDIKKKAQLRVIPKLDPKTPEGIQQEIERLTQKLATMKGK